MNSMQQAWPQRAAWRVATQPSVFSLLNLRLPPSRLFRWLAIILISFAAFCVGGVLGVVRQNVKTAFQ